MTTLLTANSLPTYLTYSCTAVAKYIKTGKGGLEDLLEAAQEVHAARYDDMW